MPLYLNGLHSPEYIPLDSAEPSWGLGLRTVTVDGKVYFSGSANYAMWGAMYRMCRDAQQLYNWGKESYSLSDAEHAVKLWKWWNNDHPSERSQQAIEFTRYGYQGSALGPGLSISYLEPNGTEVRGKFDWYWAGVKGKTSGRVD